MPVQYLLNSFSCKNFISSTQLITLIIFKIMAEVQRKDKNLQKDILELQQRLVALVNQKAGELTRRINERDEQISNQISQLRLSFTNSQSNQPNKPNISNAKLYQFQNSLTPSLDKLKLIQETIKGLTGNIEATRKQVSTLEANLQKQILREGDNLSLVVSNFSTSFFGAFLEPNKWNITYLAGDKAWRGFIRNFPLPLNQVSTCQIRQTKTKGKEIMTGIATNAIFGTTYPHQNKECLAYCSQDGQVSENGSWKQGGRVVSDGEVIAIRVNTADWQIKWSVGSQELAATMIPQQMRSKCLYFVVLMCDKNDVIEILLD